jgi:hypothetical protein
MSAGHAEFRNASFKLAILERYGLPDIPYPIANEVKLTLFDDF